MQYTNTRVDILENTIRRHEDLLEILLIDRTRTTAKKTHNLIWATDSYAGHKAKDEIKVEDITGDNTRLIQPRIAKSKEEQKNRTRDKAEVFTPREIVYEMNKQVDWAGEHWPTNQDNWKDYVLENKLEITCGEAPFIVGRYNAANGEKILDLKNRVGFLDAKMREVSRYCEEKEDWIFWAKNAFKASYGYEWQGDNLILARENLFYTFIDYYNDKFPNDVINLDRQVSEKKMGLLKEIAEIISWNIFQMDGLKYIIPMSGEAIGCEIETPPMLKILGEKPQKSKAKKATFVKIMDWEKGKSIKFASLVK